MSNINKLLEIMAQLRDPEKGCPLDREQTFDTIVPFTIEEAYEVADTIERKSMDDLREELGDLLFQVVFYARMAQEQGLFEFDQVVDGIVDKLIRRHPHVFGEVDIQTAGQQTHAWEAHKAKERAAKADAQRRVASLLDGIPVTLPALTRAMKLHKRAARVGFDWDKLHDVMDKVEEEIQEIDAEIQAGAEPQRMEDEIGDLLFVTTILARHACIDPETALRKANAKFERRFRRIEHLLHVQGSNVEQATLDEMDRLWDQVKVEEKQQ
jgi:ATP diphosphatase